MRTVRELILDAWSALGFKAALGDGITPPQPSAAWYPPLWTGETHHRRLTAYHLLAAYDSNSARRFRQALGSEQGSVREYGDAHVINRTILAAVLGDEQAITVEGTDDDGEDGTATKAQDWYRQWWTDERGPLKQHRTERRAIKFGNGVYTLGWDPTAGRPRLRDYDPACYFPAWQDGDEEFPSRVHLAWEIDDPQQRTVIRRITWDLRDSGAERDYPWREQTTRLVCYLSDALFVLDHARRGETIDDLDPAGATYRTDDQGEIRDRDLGIDFVPVISLTNTIDDGDGWGEPSIMAITQVLDDLSQTDSDVQASAATAAKPVLLIPGLTGDDSLSYAPGEVISGGDGVATILDTSKALDALLKQVDSLSHRMTVNARVPDALLGRVAPSEVPSGLALALSFGPLVAMIAEMRLARAEKYRLLFEFARRLALAGGAKDVPDDDSPVSMEFGAYLPSDKAGTVELVRQLLGGPGEQPVIPVETAVALLVDAGFAIDDAEAMVELLRRQDYAAATKLLDATGDEEAVRELLHTGKLPDLSGPPPEPPQGMPAPGVPAQTPPGQQPAGTPAQPPQGAANQGGSNT